MRIIVVVAFARWRQLRDEKDMKTEDFSADIRKFSKDVFEENKHQDPGKL